MRLKGQVIAAVVCAALAGCGGDDEEKTTAATPATTATSPTTTTETTSPTTTDEAPDPDYRAKVEKAAVRFKRESESAAAKLRSASNPAEFGAGADEFQSAVKTFNGKLASLTPPADAARPQERLIEVLDQFADDVGTVRSALDRGDTQGIAGLTSKIQSDAADVEAAARALQDAAE